MYLRIYEPWRPPVLPAWTLFAASSMFPIWGCLSERRTTHCPRNVTDPGLFSGGAKVALRFPCAGPRVMSLLTISPAAPAAIRLLSKISRKLS